MGENTLLIQLNVAIGYQFGFIVLIKLLLCDFCSVDRNYENVLILEGLRD